MIGANGKVYISSMLEMVMALNERKNEFEYSFELSDITAKDTLFTLVEITRRINSDYAGGVSVFCFDDESEKETDEKLKIASEWVVKEMERDA